tara:strand:+ start:1043 stop:3589 length:2547 start_codon:yes stop_codon:yes gene_type:complete
MQNVLQRNMFQNNSPKVSAEGVGITDGLMEDEKEASAEALGQVAEGMDKVFGDIDAAENPKGIMDALRGNNMSIEERKAELAELVGEADAKKTPESVLTLIQPTLTILEMAEKQSKGEGGITDAMSMGNETPIQAPGTEEAVMRMASGEKPVGFAHGGFHSVGYGEAMIPGKENNFLQNFSNFNPAKQTSVQDVVGNQPDSASMLALINSFQGKAPKRSDYVTKKDSSYKAYADMLPGMSLAKIGAQIANTGKGESLIGSLLDPEFMKGITDPIQQLALLKAKEDSARETSGDKQYTDAIAAQKKQRTDMIKTILPELAKSGVETFQSDGDTFILNKKTGMLTNLTEAKGSFSLVDTYDNNGNTVKAKLNSRTGDLETLDGKSVDNNKFTFKEIPGKGLVALDKGTGSATFVSGTIGKNNIISGNKDTGFLMVDLNTGATTPLDGLGGVAPTTDLINDTKRFGEAQAFIKNTENNKGSGVYAENLQFMETYIAKYKPNSEFQNLLSERINIESENLKASGLSEEGITKKLNEMKVNYINDYLTKKSTHAGQYDKDAADKKTFSEIWGKIYTKLGEDNKNLEKLAGFGTQLKLASTQFKTGAFGSQRLFLGKVAEQYGLTEAFNGFSGGGFSKFLAGSDVGAGELIESLGAQFAVSLASNFPGNLNQSEVDLIETAGAGIFNTKEGIELISSIYEGQLKQAQEHQKIFDQVSVESEKAGESPLQRNTRYSKAIAKYNAENPIVNEALAQRIRDKAAGIDGGPVVDNSNLLFAPAGVTDKGLTQNVVTNFGGVDAVTTTISNFKTDTRDAKEIANDIKNGTLTFPGFGSNRSIADLTKIITNFRALEKVR